MFERFKKKNQEGYHDPTACEALNNILEEERNRAMHDIKRGDIFYINKYDGPVGPDNPGRPAVVVSSDRIIRQCDFIQIAYCTLNPKYDLPTHVLVKFLGNKNSVLCEQVNTVNISRIGDYIATCTDEEMKRIDIGLMSAFGLDFEKTDKVTNDTNVVNKVPATPAQTQLKNKLDELKEQEEAERLKTMVPVEKQIKLRREEESLMEKIEKSRLIGMLEGERDTYKAMYEKAIEALINK